MTSGAVLTAMGPVVWIYWIKLLGIQPEPDFARYEIRYLARTGATTR